jgi:adenosine kinase
MSTLICGSFAFDTIMVFDDRFKHHILPEQVHILNVSFMVPELRREFGGCAGNIAYNLQLLGGKPLPMGTVGKDFGPYAQWMDRNGIPRTHVTEVENTYTAQAFITTDMDDNQITAFHPGAMGEAHRNLIADAQGLDLAIVSPDGRDGMIEHARDLAETCTPFVFDPGQGLPMFDGDDLLRFLDQATYLAVNDYESELMQERTGLSMEAMAQRVEGVVVTRGAKGSTIFAGGEQTDIPAVTPERVADPTGCGDAFRAGLLYGLASGMDWETTGRIASLMGTFKVEQHGTQNHTFTRDAFAGRFEQAFGYHPW